MAQLTLRSSEELLERVKRAAARQGRSMNEYVVGVLDAATNPSLAGSEAERLRERLDAAGLLASHSGRRRRRPPAEALEQARRAAGNGTSLARIVRDER
ncbi:MAG: toxin-antitoxin system HicB family antitoxin [Acidimicrobiales bacterium]